MLSAHAISDLLFDAEALLRRGIVRHGQGDPHGALDDFRAAAEADPARPQAWNNCGAVRQALGDLVGAVADFDQALALDPRYADALSNRGRAQQLLGDFSGAREDFERGLECATGRFTATLLHNRAALRQAVGDLAGALADYDAALELAPGQVASLLCRAAARKESRDLAGALADLDLALELTAPEAAAALYHQRGGVRVLLNDFTGAIADYDLALALNPDQYLVYVSRGHARYHRRDVRGLADYRMAFRLNPEGAARELVRLLREDAARAPEAILDNCAKHLRISDKDALAHGRRGLTLLLLGRDAEAAADLARFREVLAGSSEPFEQVLKLVLASRPGPVVRFTGA